MPKIKALSLLSCSFKRTLIVLSSSPSNTTTYRGCTRRPKPPFGLLKKSTSHATSWTGIDSRRHSNTSSHTFSPSLLPPMASSMKTSAATSQQRSRRQKPGVSMASKLPSRTSTVRHTHSLSTHASRTPQRRCTSYKRSKPSLVSNGKHGGCLDGANPL